MGSFKIRDYIKGKVGLQPSTRCPICFDFVDDDSNDTSLKHTLEHIHLSAAAGCFTCGILKDAVDGMYEAGVIPMDQLFTLHLGAGSSLTFIDEHDNSLTPTLNFYNPGTYHISPTPTFL